MKTYEELKAEVESEYPQKCEMLKEILEEEYKLFIRKQYDYGPTNITVGQDMNKPDGRQVAKAGLVFRVNDKLQRLVNLIVKKRGLVEAANEPIVDAWSDTSLYCKIAQLVDNGVWGK